MRVGCKAKTQEEKGASEGGRMFVLRYVRSVVASEKLRRFPPERADMAAQKSRSKTYPHTPPKRERERERDENKS